ncbi:MAG: lipopolysaccharide kinase InaA family protein [Pseudomonadota bacterium]
MKGYTYKKYKNLGVWVKESLCPEFSDAQLQDYCLQLFSKENNPAIIKEGTYKKIFTAKIHTTPGIVKIYRSPGFLRQLKTFFSPSRAMREFQAAAYVYHKGIPTAEPLLLAERKKWGCVQEGLVAVRFIEEAQELRDFLFYEKNIALSEKRKIITEFGRLTDKIFKNGIFQYDYALNNFMIRKDGERRQLYFIDFEKVTINKEPSSAQQLDILARLNRVGREVSPRDRLRFLRGYSGAGSARTKEVLALARTLQKETIQALKKDVGRSRLTSIYTHARYDRIKLSSYAGLCRKGHLPQEIINKIKNIPAGRHQVEISLTAGQPAALLKALQFSGDEAGKMWAAMSVLIIAGAPLELPHVLIEDSRRGFLLFPVSASGQFENFTRGESSRCNFIKTNFPEEFAKIKRMAQGLGKC